MLKPEDVQVQSTLGNSADGTRKYFVLCRNRRLNFATTEGSRLLKGVGLPAWKRLMFRLGEISPAGIELTIEFDSIETATCITVGGVEGRSAQDAVWRQIDPEIREVLRSHALGLYPRSAFGEKISKIFPRSRKGLSAIRRNS